MSNITVLHFYLFIYFFNCIKISFECSCFCLGSVMEELSARFPELIAEVLCSWLSDLASH